MLSKSSNPSMPAATKVIFSKHLFRNEFKLLSPICDQWSTELRKQADYKDSIQQAINDGHGQLALILLKHGFPVSKEFKPSLVTTALDKKFDNDDKNEDKLKIVTALVKAIPPSLEDLKTAKQLGEKFLNSLILNSRYDLALHKSLIELFENNILKLIEYCIQNNVLDHVIQCIGKNAECNLVSYAAEVFANKKEQKKDQEDMLAAAKTLLQHGMSLSAKALNSALECKDERMMQVLVNNFQSINPIFPSDGSDMLTGYAATSMWKYPNIVLYFIRKKISLNILPVQIGLKDRVDSVNIYPMKMIFEFYHQKQFSQEQMMSILEAIKKHHPQLVTKEEVLDLAILTGDEKLVKFLIENGAPVLPVFGLGDNALDKATKKSHIQIVKMLLDEVKVAWDLRTLNYTYRLCTTLETDRIKQYLFCVMTVAKSKLLDVSQFQFVHKDDQEDLVKLLEKKYGLNVKHYLKIDVKSAAPIKVLDSKDQVDVVESKQIASPVAVGLFKTETQQMSTQSADRESWLKRLKQCVEEGHLYLKEQESLPTLIESMLVEMHSKKSIS